MYLNSKTGCVAVGHAGKDGEYSVVGDKSTPLLKFSLAVAKDEVGQGVWFNCQAWNPVASRYKGKIRKGEVYQVFGTWENREHNGKTYSTLIVQFIGEMVKTADDAIIQSDDVLDESELPF